MPSQNASPSSYPPPTGPLLPLPNAPLQKTPKTPLKQSSTKSLYVSTRNHAPARSHLPLSATENPPRLKDDILASNFQVYLAIILTSICTAKLSLQDFARLLELHRESAIFLWIQQGLPPTRTFHKSTWENLLSSLSRTSWFRAMDLDQAESQCANLGFERIDRAFIVNVRAQIIPSLPPVQPPAVFTTSPAKAIINTYAILGVKESFSLILALARSEKSLFQAWCKSFEAQLYFQRAINDILHTSLPQQERMIRLTAAYAIQIYVFESSIASRDVCDLPDTLHPQAGHSLCTAINVFDQTIGMTELREFVRCPSRQIADAELVEWQQYLGLYTGVLERQSGAGPDRPFQASANTPQHQPQDRETVTRPQASPAPPSDAYIFQPLTRVSASQHQQYTHYSQGPETRPRDSPAPHTSDSCLPLTRASPYQRLPHRPPLYQPHQDSIVRPQTAPGTAALPALPSSIPALPRVLPRAPNSRSPRPENHTRPQSSPAPPAPLNSNASPPSSWDAAPRSGYYLTKWQELRRRFNLKRIKPEKEQIPYISHISDSQL